jgi:hypothetical protein
MDVFIEALPGDSMPVGPDLAQRPGARGEGGQR